MRARHGSRALQHGHLAPPAWQRRHAAAGAYVAATGATNFVLCPKGTFANLTGITACELCGAGQYSSSPGSKACQACRSDTYSGGRAASCSDCLPGYTSTPSSWVCSACPINTYTNTMGQMQCTKCGPGETTRGLVGQSVCSPYRQQNWWRLLRGWQRR
ncbi:hypothetical protein ABPG75_010460 [Micractinium tetrahymenae]